MIISQSFEASNLNFKLEYHFSFFIGPSLDCFGWVLTMIRQGEKNCAHKISLVQKLLIDMIRDIGIGSVVIDSENPGRCPLAISSLEDRVKKGCLQKKVTHPLTLSLSYQLLSVLTAIFLTLAQNKRHIAGAETKQKPHC